MTMIRPYGPNEPWADFIEACWERNLELGDVIPRQECEVLVYAETLPKVSINEAVSSLAGRMGAELAYWGLVYVPDIFPAAARHHLIEAVCADPALASIAYRQAPDLSETEQSALWSAFCDVLPVTVAKLVAMGGGCNG